MSIDSLMRNHRDGLPEQATGRFTAITDDKGDDLSRSAAHRRPEPAFVGLLEHKGPDFIKFKDVIVLRRRQGLNQRRVRL